MKSPSIYLANVDSSPPSTTITPQVVPFPQFDIQAQYLAALWGRKMELPSKTAMHAHTAADRARRAALGFPVHYAHRMGAEQWEYNDALCEAAGIPPLERWRQEVSEEARSV